MNAPQEKRRGHGANTWRRRRRVPNQREDEMDVKIPWSGCFLYLSGGLCGGEILGGGG